MEADFQGSFGSGGTLTATGATPITATLKDPWFGTFRGRIGYAWDRALFYATAGGVYGDGTANGVSGGIPFNNSTTYVTWTAGAGIEAAFWGPLSAKIEYLYVRSPSSLPTIPNLTGVSGIPSPSMIRAGLNYHF